MNGEQSPPADAQTGDEPDLTGLTDDQILALIDRWVAQEAPQQSQSAQRSNKAKAGLKLLRQAGISGERDPMLEQLLGSELAAQVRQHSRAEPREIYEPNQTIAGRYRLISLIGEGGMGSVWVAEQSEPVRRKVALKLIKPGMDSRQVLSRFEAERQALAAMDHPNIAKILDGGLTEQHRPYFAMELVNGASLTKFCDDMRSSIPDRLQLFCDISQAVQHAHLKGIIHRDLKPSNILVTVIDGRPVPKIIDFGLAKAFQDTRLSDSLQTKFGAVVGTLEYMSPEQAGYSGQDVDTRADIYSLGVILYELLTGMRPLDDRQLHGAAWDEMLRVIKEVDPVRPSIKLSSSESAPSYAAQRQLEPRKLSGLLRRELDWIVMKTLEKDRNRRYETASALVADIQNFLIGQPVSAHPPSAGYRFRKFVRRNRATVIAGSLIFLALLAGLVSTLYAAGIARSEARRADDRASAAELAEKEQKRLAQLEMQQRAETERQRVLAEQAAEAERKRAEELERVSNFQMAMLREVKTHAAGKHLVQTLVDAVEKSLRQLELPDEDLQSRRQAFQEQLSQINATDVAIEVLVENILRPAEEAIDKQDEKYRTSNAAIQQGLAEAMRSIGRLDDAQRLMEQAVATQRAVHGNSHPVTIAGINELGLVKLETGQPEAAKQLLDESLTEAEKTFGPDHPTTFSVKNNLGLWHRAMGQRAEAEQLFRDVAQRSLAVSGPDDEDTISFHANWGLALSEQRKYREAEPIARDVLERRRRLQGDDHPETLLAMNNLGFFLYDLGHKQEAESIFKELVERARRVLGEDHPQTIDAMQNYGGICLRENRKDEAEAYWKECLEKYRRVLGPKHPTTLFATSNFSSLLFSQGKYEEAEKLRLQTMPILRQIHPAHHPEILRALNGLAILYENTSRASDAEPLRREILESMLATVGKDHAQALSGNHDLAKNLSRQERHSDAETYFRESARISQLTWGETHANTAVAKRILADNLVAQQKFAEAEQELLAAEANLFADANSTRDRREQMLKSIIALYQAWHAQAADKGYDQKASTYQQRLDALK